MAEGRVSPGRWRRRRCCCSGCLKPDTPAPILRFCRLRSLPQQPLTLRHQQHAAAPQPRREVALRAVARAAAPEKKTNKKTDKKADKADKADKPSVATSSTDLPGKGRSGASGIGSGIKLDNVRSCCWAWIRGHALAGSACGHVGSLSTTAWTPSNRPHSPLPTCRLPSPLRTSRCCGTSAGT